MIPSAGPRPPRPGRVSPAIRDRAVTGVLIAVLAVSALALAIPHGVATVPAGAEAPSEVPSASPAAPLVYREGVVGRPASITPVTAQTRADRTLVGLIFSGLVKTGPGGTLVPDLAASWSVDKAGKVWTVAIRPDASWQDGQPVTADDVVYTVDALKDPSSGGAQAAAWADVTVAAVDSKTVTFTLGSPVGGFLAALTQPLLPAHLLQGVSFADLATSAFALSPVGTGPYQLVQLDTAHAMLLPAPGVNPAASPAASAAPSGAAPPSLAPSGSDAPAPSAAPSVGAAVDGPAAAGLQLAAAATGKPKPTTTPKPRPTTSPTPTPSPSPSPSPTATPDPGARPIGGIEIDFFDSETALAAAFTAGQIDGAAGLSGATTQALGAEPGVKVSDYPTTTLSAVLLNLRPTQPELQSPNVRKALLDAIDRSAIAATALVGQARVADALVPPESWAYDAAAVAPVAPSLPTSAKLLAGAGWTKKSGKWYAPKAKAPYAIELLTVPADVNPRLAAVATAVQADWAALGLAVTVTSLSGSDLAARLQAGTFSAAVLDIASGIEPDLYPLLDSTQVRANGSNRSGYQDPALDSLLEAARAYGSTAKSKAAWSALLAGLSARLPVLPIVWANEEMVSRGVSGNTPELIVHPGDRFWDVLAWRLAASR